MQATTSSKTNGRGRWRWWLVAVVPIGAGHVAAAWALYAGGPRGLQAEPSEVHFGVHDVGGESTETVTVTNRGGAPSIASIRIVGEHAVDFAVTDASTCSPGTINKDASCTVVVRFAPTEQGDRATELSVMGLAAGELVWLSGTGAATP